MKNYKWFITLFILIMCNAAKAQLPFGDPAWILQTGLSDEFDTLSLNRTKWNTNYWGSSLLANGAEINYDSNVVLNGATLSLIADTLIPNYFESDTTKLWYGYNTPNQGLTYAYQSGVIQAKLPLYKFGYYEISAKYPAKNYSLWPAFWLFSRDSNATEEYLGELDIAENGSETVFNGNEVANWYHISDTTMDYNYALNGGGIYPVLPATDSMSGAFHKFALEWNPHSITYYFDDVPTTKLYDTSGHNIPQHFMTVIIALGLDPLHAYLPADWTGINEVPRQPVEWPQHMEMEYFHYYKLTSDCNTNTTVCVPTDYDRKVKKSITTNSSCSPNFSPSTAAGSYNLRATDYILINQGTEINPSGSGFFTIEATACPQ
jgi:beta-glucanase (GH16 family)